MIGATGEPSPLSIANAQASKAYVGIVACLCTNLIEQTSVLHYIVLYFCLLSLPPWLAPPVKIIKNNMKEEDVGRYIRRRSRLRRALFRYRKLTFLLHLRYMLTSIPALFYNLINRRDGHSTILPFANGEVICSGDYERELKEVFRESFASTDVRSSPQSIVYNFVPVFPVPIDLLRQSDESARSIIECLKISAAKRIDNVN